MPERHLTDYSSVDMKVEREAHGGFGRVYMGPDDRFRQGEWFALKTLHPQYLATDRGRSLFLNECLTWVGLWPHPNLLTAHIVAEIDSQLFLLLAYAEKGSLRDRFYAMRQRNSWFSDTAALAYAQMIAAGLLALHTPDPDHLRLEPIVHRDLKPENILLNQRNYAKITDFGLAKVIAQLDSGDITAEMAETVTTTTNAASGTGMGITQSRRYRTPRGVAMGTFPYMAPEQWVDAANADTPVDIYAFGIILAELFARQHPLLAWERGGSNAEAWRLAHFQGQPRPLDLHLGNSQTASETLEELYQSMVAERAEERPTAETVLRVLQQVAERVGDKPYTPPETFSHTPENEQNWWHRRAYNYRVFGFYDQALACNDRALALIPSDSNALLEQGTILAGLGRLDESLNCYDRALATYPPDDHIHRAAVWNQRANRLCNAGRHAETDAASAQAIELEPTNPHYWYNRALHEGQWWQALVEAGEPEVEQHLLQGLDYIEQALQLNPNDPAYSSVRADLHHSLVLDRIRPPWLNGMLAPTWFG